LTTLKILRHSFLRINGETDLSLDVHIWELAKQGLPDDNPRLQDIERVMLGDK